jgi:hypothetical protein
LLILAEWLRLHACLLCCTCCNTLSHHNNPETSLPGTTAKKLVSLSEKYFSIPPEYLSYYPHVEQVAQVEHVVSENGAGNEAGAGKEADQQRPVADEQRAKRPKNTVAVGAKKPGRPPKHQAKMVPKGQRSLLTFLHSRSKSSNSSSSSST